MRDKRFERKSSLEAYFHVDKVLDVRQGNPEQVTHQLHVALLHSQVQNRLVAFDFLELGEIGGRVVRQ